MLVQVEDYEPVAFYCKKHQHWDEIKKCLICLKLPKCAMLLTKELNEWRGDASGSRLVVENRDLKSAIVGWSDRHDHDQQLLRLADLQIKNHKTEIETLQKQNTALRAVVKLAKQICEDIEMERALRGLEPYELNERLKEALSSLFSLA